MSPWLPDASENTPHGQQALCFLSIKCEWQDDRAGGKVKNESLREEMEGGAVAGERA
ncbi:hypothetical protein [Chimaeribacter coloradensis]|uniref:hypothetical protein n=1 Tax=Chimaeribacter coloradensis TaxID=2060068 RepID=UPI0013FCF7E2|nr:hypothetical protein [Chimaeribacter coloradensis]